MTLCASIDHRTTTRRPIQETFIALHNFLSSTCFSAGVTRIACNFGNGGTAFGYHDSGATTGNNAWALFKFNSASNPFHMLVQYNESDTFGNSPGSPALADAGTGVNRIAISYAMRVDGLNPWNGSAANNGADSKGTPVWTSSSLNDLLVFPRSNYLTGSHATNRQNMMIFVKTDSYSAADLFNISQGGTGAVYHFFADENNFLGLFDAAALGNFQATYFGKYTPRSDITASHPYVALGLYEDSTDRTPFTVTALYGFVSGTTSTTFFRGGLAHPSASQYGVRTYNAVLNNYFFLSRFHPNRSIATASNRYDIQKPMLILNEEPTHYGYVGTIDFFKLGWGMPNAAMSGSGNSAAFNVHYAAGFNRVWSTYLKMIVPWTGSIQPYSLTSRLGYQFTR